MRFEIDRVRNNVRAATTEDLLDRLTVYRQGMEPAAIELIETELDRRGIREEEIHRHADHRRGVVMDGQIARRCSLCDRPAVRRGWGWFRLAWRTIPVLPRRVYYCETHAGVSPS